MKLYSFILIPFLSVHNFLDLKYDSIKPNKVNFDKTIVINVNESASPLFYPLVDSKKLNSIKMVGEVEIEKAIGENEKDSYFQLGIIYEGNYRPSGFVKRFLPEWLLSVLNLSPNKGLSEIEFFEVSDGRVINKEDNIRDIKLVFKNIAKLKEKSFSFEVKPQDKKILGFWLRSDGDDSKAKFNVKILKFEID